LQEDSVLFASTNFPEHLDEALRRPGRFDVDVPFTYANHDQACSIFKHFYEAPETSGSPAEPETIIDEKLRLADAALKFADTIKNADINVTLATIQGYLLLYKRDPVNALEKAAEWAQGIKAKQAASDDKVGEAEKNV
jgi:chaperone BCS1